MSAEIQLKTARDQLLGAMIGWESVLYPSMNGAQYDRGQHLFMNAALLWHQFMFSATYYVQANLAENAVYTQIEKLVTGYYPDIDPKTIKHILTTGGIAPLTTNGDPTKYHECLSILTDLPMDEWIVRLPGPSKDPGYISEAEILVAKPPFVNAPDRLQGDFT